MDTGWLLGVTAIQLSHDLDGVTLAALAAEGRLSNPPAAPFTIPGGPVAEQALGGRSPSPRCIPSCSSHSPQSEIPMSPIPMASVTRAPQPSSSLARNAAHRHPARPRRARSTRAAQSKPRSPVHSTMWAAYDGVRTAASAAGARRERAARCSRSRRGCAEPIRSNDASAAPATNGPRCRSRRSAGPR
jgi:hypothetical protein